MFFYNQTQFFYPLVQGFPLDQAIVYIYTRGTLGRNGMTRNGEEWKHECAVAHIICHLWGNDEMPPWKEARWYHECTNQITIVTCLTGKMLLFLPVHKKHLHLILLGLNKVHFGIALWWHTGSTPHLQI